MERTSLKEHSLRLLRLPRELRDMIYPYLVAERNPISLSDSKPHPITDPTYSNAVVAPEALEAYYTHNTFILSIQPTKLPLASQRWGPHLEVAQSHARSIIIAAEEPVKLLPPTLSFSDFEVQHANSPGRQIWRELLELPKLANLTIQMQKYYDDRFSWMLFAPVVMSLRQQKPDLEFHFTVSFDAHLEKFWNDPMWSRIPNIDMVDTYQPMGYIDMTELFDKPSQEDMDYVQEYLPDKLMPRGRSIRSGLLDAVPAERRSLGHLYVVKEPNLLRVLMEEHFEVYKRYDKWRRAKDEAPVTL